MVFVDVLGYLGHNIYRFFEFAEYYDYLCGQFLYSLGPFHFFYLILTEDLENVGQQVPDTVVFGMYVFPS